MQIIARLETLRRREHGATVALIETLVACQRTRAYADAGYDSVWSLLVRRLGYSPAAASRRVAAMRCVMKCPRALELLRARRTTLSALHAIAKTLLESEDVNALLEEIDGAPHAEVERVVARARPVAKPVERIQRKVIARRPAARSSMSSDAELPLVAAPTSMQSEASSSPPSTAPTEERVQLTLSLPAADYARLEAAKHELSGKYPRGMTLEQLFLELLARVERKPTPRSTTKPTSNAKSTTPTRHVHASVRRTVFERDQGRCTFVGPDGTTCGSRHDLEIDHIKPWARGGTHEPSNLRVLCATHNRRRAELEFGAIRRANRSAIRTVP